MYLFVNIRNGYTHNQSIYTLRLLDLNIFVVSPGPVNASNKPYYQHDGLTTHTVQLS